jgi:hypothetical protein
VLPYKIFMPSSQWTKILQNLRNYSNNIDSHEAYLMKFTVNKAYCIIFSS